MPLGRVKEKEGAGVEAEVEAVKVEGHHPLNHAKMARMEEDL